MMEWPILTNDGIASAAILERPTLKSLSVRWISYQSHDNIRLHFIDSLVSLKDLTSLDLSPSHISDDLLSTIAMRGLPLRRLVLQNCTGYSYAGIFGSNLTNLALFAPASNCPSLDEIKMEYATVEIALENE
ncbi:F-box/LRR-repeat protein, partial [Trifolium pratense]